MKLLKRIVLVSLDAPCFCYPLSSVQIRELAAFYSDAVHDSSAARIVVQSRMPRGPVVPKRHGTRQPVKAMELLWLRRVTVECLQQGPGLLHGHAFEANGERGVHEKHPTSTVGMCQHNGMHRVLRRLLPVPQPVTVQQADIPKDVLARMHCIHAEDLELQILGQGLEGPVHVHEQSVASDLGQLPGHQDGAQTRVHIVTGVRVEHGPEIDNVALVLEHLCHLRMSVDLLEKAIHVDGTEELGKVHVLLR
mmetsp:Transcript_43263/g.113825  ORF Transcript_43263/g.113825 Transcript_43263/m.113825 type:complete len:250 (-) Transcript_43263:194-943(-)